MGEDAVRPHRAHVEIMVLGPAENLGVEVESLVYLTGVKLAPADIARVFRSQFAWRIFRWDRRHDAKHCAMRIGDNGKPADAWNIVRLALNPATE
ncbi:hypothetical protein D3C87_1303550 [compost metagenome]